MFIRSIGQIDVRPDRQTLGRTVRHPTLHNAHEAVNGKNLSTHFWPPGHGMEGVLGEPDLEPVILANIWG